MARESGHGMQRRIEVSAQLDAPDARPPVPARAPRPLGERRQELPSRGLGTELEGIAVPCERLPQCRRCPRLAARTSSRRSNAASAVAACHSSSLALIPGSRPTMRSSSKPKLESSAIRAATVGLRVVTRPPSPTASGFVAWNENTSAAPWRPAEALLVDRSEPRRGVDQQRNAGLGDSLPGESGRPRRRSSERRAGEDGREELSRARQVRVRAGRARCQPSPSTSANTGSNPAQDCRRRRRERKRGQDHLVLSRSADPARVRSASIRPSVPLATGTAVTPPPT